MAATKLGVHMARNGPTTGMPGWVKGFAWAGGIAVILVAVMLLTGHGPWQHLGMAGSQ
jgi:hypothetical protein